MAGYDVTDAGDLDGTMKKVRRELGVSAFGINLAEIPPGQPGR